MFIPEFFRRHFGKPSPPRPSLAELEQEVDDALSGIIHETFNLKVRHDRYYRTLARIADGRSLDAKGDAAKALRGPS